MNNKVPSHIAHIDNTDYEIGQDNIQVFGMDMHNPVFAISSIVILAFVIFTLIFTADAKSALDASKSWTINNFHWLFMICANFVLIFCVVLIFTPLGKIRLGGESATTEFSRASWLAMLFSAGMGIGLLFWSVAEPMAYYTAWWGSPLNVEKLTPEAADVAMAATMYHWGFHAWAIYAIVGLALGFFTFNRGLPLSIRSAFYPLLGERVWGWPGHIIDIFAVFATLFGLATSLGLGAQQAASGLNFLFDIPNGTSTQIALIIFITSIAIVSVVRGLEGGVKVLSNINMIVAFVVLVLVTILGLGFGFFNELFNTASAYAQYILPLSDWIDREDTTFYKDWTVFYWAWWISWSPFVGMFIARISKGRTIREFLSAVLIVPVLVTLIWMSSFGGEGLNQAANGVGELANGLGDISLALFHMYENLPFGYIVSFVSIILLVVFFVTSSDSGSLVIDSITSGGKLETPVPQRIFWAVMEGLVAGVLLFGGGADALKALQAGTITSGLPFAIILLLLCVSTTIGLINEHKMLKAR